MAPRARNARWPATSLRLPQAPSRSLPLNPMPRGPQRPGTLVSRQDRSATQSPRRQALHRAPTTVPACAAPLPFLRTAPPRVAGHVNRQQHRHRRSRARPLNARSPPGRRRNPLRHPGPAQAGPPARRAAPGGRPIRAAHRPLNTTPPAVRAPDPPGQMAAGGSRRRSPAGPGAPSPPALHRAATIRAETAPTRTQPMPVTLSSPPGRKTAPRGMNGARDPAGAGAAILAHGHRRPRLYRPFTLRQDD